MPIPRNKSVETDTPSPEVVSQTIAPETIKTEVDTGFVPQDVQPPESDNEDAESTDSDSG